MQKYDFFTNTARNKSLSVIPGTSFRVIFDWIIHFWYYFDDSRSSSMSKVNFNVKHAKV